MPSCSQHFTKIKYKKNDSVGFRNECPRPVFPNNNPHEHKGRKVKSETGMNIHEMLDEVEVNAGSITEV